MIFGLKEGEKYCDFCVLIVPTDHECPVAKRLAENPRQSDAPGVVWNCGGATRGYGKTSYAPALEGVNFGHNPPTAQKLGLTSEDCAELGI